MSSPAVPVSRWLWAAALAVCGLKLAWAANTGLLADEAYYWVWSQHLALGYYDHPPGIAYLIAVTTLLSSSELWVRLGPVLAGLVGWAALVPWSEDRSLFTLLWFGTPILCGLTLFATPDALLIGAWAVALAGALSGGRGWWVAGLAVGVAGLAKLTGLLLWPLLWLAAHPDERSSPSFRGGVALSVLLWAPNLWWSASHGWVSHGFQLQHGLVADVAPGWLGLLDFAGGQLAVGAGLTSVAGLWWWLRLDRGDALVRMAWVTSLPMFALFAFASTRAHGEANWTAPAFVGVALALSTTEPRSALGRLTRTGAWVGAAATVIVALQAFTPILHLPTDPAIRLTEGRVLARSVAAFSMRYGRPPSGELPDDLRTVLTERHQDAALIHYYSGIPAVVWPGCGRPSQYSLWPTPPLHEPLFLRPARHGPLTCVEPELFASGVHRVLRDPDSAGRRVGPWDLIDVNEVK